MGDKTFSYKIRINNSISSYVGTINLIGFRDDDAAICMAINKFRDRLKYEFDLPIEKQSIGGKIIKLMSY